MPGDPAVDLRISLLGPVQVRVDGELVRVTSRLQRATIAFLALNAGHVVSTVALIDALWGERAPDTVTGALQVHVSGLRKALGPAAYLLSTRPPGYLLTIPEDNVDVLVLEAAVRAARDSAVAPELPERAWSDEVLADLQDVPFVPAVTARLQELRWAFQEERVEAALAAGRHAAVVPDVEEMLRAQPYRERLWRTLIIALYRSGRQADALGAYRRAARVLAEDLGLDPGPALSAVHHAVLTNDPVLLAPPDTAQAPARLPERQGPLIGRERELAELLAALQDERLVTLTGPGGVGKTTLAHEAALTLTRAGGPVEGLLVDLAAVTDPDDVLPAIAELLHVPAPEGPDADPAAAIALRLGDRRVLVLLDTMEHLRPAGRDLVRLVSTAPGVRLLITSRTSLNLAKERVLTLGPLPAPAAAELFVRRARGATAPTDADDPVVVALCSRLDGIPLALELAAARCRLMNPSDLLARLDDRLTLLGSDVQDRPQRHRTMQATLEWSVDLLSPGPRALFLRWGATAGTFTLDDLLSVLESGEATDARSLITDLDTLVDASLVVVSGGRYRMLDMVRAFARDLLERSGETKDAQHHHLAWALRRCAAAAVELSGPDEDLAVAGLRGVLPDLRLAATAAFANGWHDEGARVVLGARRAWVSAGLFTELARLLDQAAEGDLDRLTAAEVAGLSATVRKILGLGDADDLAVAAAALRSEPGGETMLVNVLCHQAALLAEAEQSEAVPVAAEAVAVARASGSSGDLAMALDLSGYVARALGDRELAVVLAREAVEMAGAKGAQLALALAGLCAGLAEAGRPREALDPGLEAIARVRSSGQSGTQAEVVGTVAEALGADLGVSFARDMADAVAVLVAYGNRSSAAEVVLVLARLACANQPQAAATLAAAAQRMAPGVSADDGREALVAALGESGYAAARAEGSILGDDDIVRLARDVAEKLVLRPLD